MNQIQQITILGVGLMGGSLGLALKKTHFSGRVIGLGRKIERLEVALDCGAVDEITTDFGQALLDTDLVVICTPVDQIVSMIERILEHVASSKSLILTDVGSVKAAPVQAVDQLLASYPHLNFIGGHPMAGSEKTGVSAAHADLYQSAKCLLTPTINTSPSTLKIVTELWQSVGSAVHLLTPDQHDYLLAAASHLPHLVASVLAEAVGKVSANGEIATKYVATGFRDTTRIAAGSPELWNSIFLQNRTHLISMISDLTTDLHQFQKYLENSNGDEIHRYLTSAKQVLQTLEQQKDTT